MGTLPPLKTREKGLVVASQGVVGGTLDRSVLHFYW